MPRRVRLHVAAHGQHCPGSPAAPRRTGRPFPPTHTMPRARSDAAASSGAGGTGAGTPAGATGATGSTISPTLAMFRQQGHLRFLTTVLDPRFVAAVHNAVDGARRGAPRAHDEDEYVALIPFLTGIASVYGDLAEVGADVPRLLDHAVLDRRRLFTRATTEDMSELSAGYMQKLVAGTADPDARYRIQIDDLVYDTLKSRWETHRLMGTARDRTHHLMCKFMVNLHFPLLRGESAVSFPIIVDVSGTYENPEASNLAPFLYVHKLWLVSDTRPAITGATADAAELTPQVALAADPVPMNAVPGTPQGDDTVEPIAARTCCGGACEPRRDCCLGACNRGALARRGCILRHLNLPDYFNLGVVSSCRTLDDWVRELADPDEWPARHRRFVLYYYVATNWCVQVTPHQRWGARCLRTLTAAAPPAKCTRRLPTDAVSVLCATSQVRRSRTERPGQTPSLRRHRHTGECLCRLAHAHVPVAC